MTNELNSLIRKINENYSSGNLYPSLHISLSRTVFVKEFHIDKLRELLENEFKNFSRFTCGFNGDIEVYTNDESTTSFVALNIGVGVSHVYNSLILNLKFF